jgi:hypothetical protein
VRATPGAGPRGAGASGGAEGDDGGVSERTQGRWIVLPRRVVARWIIPVYALLAVAIIPWIVWLAWNLPERSVSSHYRLAWVGFDVLLCGALARTAWLAWRRSPFVVNVATATATLLVVDAWFDVTTSPGGSDLLVSALLGVLVELPLATFSLVIAGRAQIEIARTGAVRRRRWLRSVDPADPTSKVSSLSTEPAAGATGEPPVRAVPPG